MGRALPSRMCLSFVFPLFGGDEGCPLFFLFVRQIMGRRRQGVPHYDCASWSGVEKGYFEKPVADPKGAAAQPLPWPSGPHVAGYK